MTDEPDGDRSEDPSDATSEEDPFIYPLADDDAEDADASDDSSTAAAGADAASSGEGPSADSGPAEPDAMAGDSAGGTSSSTDRTAADSTRDRQPTSDSRAPGRPAGGGSAASSSTATSPSGRGPHVTDRRSHASDSGPGHTTRDRTAGSTARDRRRSTGATRGAGRGTATETGPSGLAGWLAWFWRADEGVVIYARDVVTSVAAVLLVGLVLFAISGIWPPMVAVESGSMEPNMQVGDLVFIIDNERFTPEEAQEYQGGTTGVVPADRATNTGRSKFGAPGDVVVYRPDGNVGQTPVIHRAMLWVEEGENWYERADPDSIGNADSCEQLIHCPAPHDGFITKGDANSQYDQQSRLSAPVRPEWIVGTAELRIPYLGHIRLAFSGQVAPPLQQDAGTALADERGASFGDEFGPMDEAEAPDRARGDGPSTPDRLASPDPRQADPPTTWTADARPPGFA